MLIRTTVLSMLVLLPAQAFAQDSPSLAFAQGLSSCARWTSDPVIELGVKSWILGYWSGMNALDPVNRFVGQSSDGAGIVALVRRECNSDPSTKLLIATDRAYQKMRDRGG